ncbi:MULTISPECIES: hypothetical protein [Streptomyces]|uniref:hypothetical protein n=1 Tax=Streptomyces TaxID=1883 RepID=UPI001603025E|nr:hypothetical protein [Streptomyces sp. gCLA4]MBZ9599602.1 hypothetical protein [Streptomyces erythrochromogenes]
MSPKISHSMLRGAIAAGALALGTLGAGAAHADTGTTTTPLSAAVSTTPEQRPSGDDLGWQ